MVNSPPGRAPAPPCGPGDDGPVTAPSGISRREALAQAREALSRAGLDGAALEARLLAADAFGTDQAGLLARGEEIVAASAASRLADHVRRRLAREPVGRILGLREFWGLPFRLSPQTLEPRPDTETVVEAALARIADRDTPAQLLDLGTGSGCLLVALLSELPRARGLGIDRSAAAAAAARANAAENGVGARAAFLCGDWAEAVEARFDLVVSNPPYIRAGALAGLAPEVARHDPRLALDGGADGLDAYRAILAALPRLLAPGGCAVLEIGFDQAGDLAELAAGAGLDMAEMRRDLAGHPRAVTLLPRARLV